MKLNWKQLIECVARSGPEQAMLDLKEGALVFRFLHDESVFSPPHVGELLKQEPDRFVDVPHPSARERAVWRATFAKQVQLHLAAKTLKEKSSFEDAVFAAKRWKDWQLFERETIEKLLMEWIERNAIPVAAPRKKRPATKKVRAATVSRKR